MDIAQDSCQGKNDDKKTVQLAFGAAEYKSIAAVIFFKVSRVHFAPSV